jgi:hypothetical protein
MKNISNLEPRLNEQLAELITKLAEIQNKITEENFAFELKRKNFFEITADVLVEDKEQKPSTLKDLPQSTTKVDEEFLNKTIRKILKI